MCRVAVADFDAEETAPAAARAWMSEVLYRWDVPWLAETAMLLTSELVSNAIRHARSRPAVTVAIADGVLEVGVTDRQPDGVPQVLPIHDPMAVGGRGMAIVEAFSDEWGVSILPTGKQIWFCLEASEWAFLTACRCHGNHIGTVLLDSGRQVLANSGPWDDLGSGYRLC